MQTIEEKSKINYPENSENNAVNLSQKRQQKAFIKGFLNAQKEYEEKLRFIPVEENLPDYKGDFSLNIEMKLDNGLILTGYKFKNTNEWFHYDYNHIGHLIQGARFVTHWRYLL